jgi:hypothetical protein
VAIHYVYPNRKPYDRIYWICATDREALMSGYKTIANEANILYPEDATK